MLIHSRYFTKQGIFHPAHFPITDRIVCHPGFLYLSCVMHGIRSFSCEKTLTRRAEGLHPVINAPGRGDHGWTYGQVFIMDIGKSDEVMLL